MLGDTLTMTLGGSGGTAKVLQKINQDGYSSEYYLRESTQEFRAKVAHSKSGERNRHFVEFKQTIFATELGDPDTIRSTSLVIWDYPADTAADVSDLTEALAYWAAEATVLKLLGWQS